MWQQLGIIGILLSPKGAAGVTGSGFIVLAATLASVGTIPGEHRAHTGPPVSEARALTNLIGNGVATVVVAKWEDALDESARTGGSIRRPTPKRTIPKPSRSRTT